VVPLQTQGRGRPVFVFPGGLGGYWTLVRDAQVATLVGRERPFFGFRRDETLRNGDRDAWIPIAAAEYARQIEAIQGPGPYLLYAICNGGVLAWETAARLLDRGETIAGILFYEVAFRAAIPEQSPRPAGPEMVRAVPRYEPPSLPVDLTLLMTEGWQSRGRSDGWRDVVQHDLETVVMPGDTPGAHNLYVGREALVAEQVRNWVARSEARLRAR
jgi:hypothetical protein